MQEENVTQDPFETHGYKKGQEILIDAEFLLGVLNFARKVQDSQPKIGALLEYPTDVKEIRNKETKDLERVDIVWKEHTNKSFANTAFAETGGVKIVTDLGMYAIQIENALLQTHINNINNGVATKLETHGDA